MSWRLKEATFFKWEGQSGDGGDAGVKKDENENTVTWSSNKEVKEGWKTSRGRCGHLVGKLDWVSWRVRGRRRNKDICSLNHWFRHGFIQFSFKQILCELSPGGKRKDQPLWSGSLQSTRGDKMANTFSCARLPGLSQRSIAFWRHKYLLISQTFPMLSHQSVHKKMIILVQITELTRKAAEAWSYVLNKHTPPAFEINRIIPRLTHLNPGMVCSIHI